MKTNTDHKKELEEVSSLIKDIEGSKQTFAAPSGYFENLPLIINDKIIKNNSQNNFYIPECNASFQNSNSNVELFSAPKNYFSTLPQKIINRIEHKNNMSNPVISIYFLKYSVAAIAVFLLGAIIFHNLTISDYSEKQQARFLL